MSFIDIFSVYDQLESKYSVNSINPINAVNPINSVYKPNIALANFVFNSCYDNPIKRKRSKQSKQSKRSKNSTRHVKFSVLIIHSENSTQELLLT